MKRRKPRGKKLDGTRSQDMCPYCYRFRCDPFGLSKKLATKFDDRLKKGLCVSCGCNPCKCKSKL